MEHEWRKSSYSGGDNGNCVEVALIDEAATVRDSKNRAGEALFFGGSAWRKFLGGMPR